jgi:opacity protein-like surface antigen
MEQAVKKTVLVVLSYLLSAPVLQAQVSTERIGVYAAGSFFSSKRMFLLDSDDLFQTKLRKGGRVGARFSADLNDKWAGEASYSFGRNNLEVDKLDPPRRKTVFETRIHQFAGNASFFFAPAGDEFRPFLTAGLTLTRFGPTDDAKARAAIDFLNRSTRIDSSTKLGFNFGGGFEAAANEWLGIRVDLKDHVMGAPKFGIPETPLNPGGVSYPISGLFQDIQISVGALFFLRY